MRFLTKALSILMLIFLPTLQAQDAALGFSADTLWVAGQELCLEGSAWPAEHSPFQRLPDSAQSLVRPALWRLSQHSAGLRIRFITDAPAIAIRWTLINRELDMPHMPATGVSGVDLYMRQADNHWQWVGNSLPRNFPQNTHILLQGVTAIKREYCLYLPLYNGVSAVEIGVPAGSKLTAAPSDFRKPLVFYGTSIIQGGCASRPGLASTAQIGRYLDRPIINLGFSGNGRMDPELAPLLAQIDAEIYIIDCLPNMSDSLVLQLARPFMQTLRRLKLQTPILLVESCWPANAALLPLVQEQQQRKAEALRSVYEELIQSGMTGLYYLYARDQLGKDGEGTVDGVHPNDLGFLRQAQHYENALQQILKQIRGAGKR